MGDTAELILEGILCQSCGEFLDDSDAPGHPRNCDGCDSTENFKK